MSWVELAVTSLIALIGLFLAHSFSRNQRLKIAEQRVDSYRKLWTLMTVARPTRTEPPEAGEPLKADEAKVLYKEMTNWYWECGNGMLLPHDTREMYLQVKQRLGHYAVQGPDTQQARSGKQVMRDLSLFRSQMKSDLDIYGVFYFDTLSPADKEFLSASGLNPERWGRPWYRWATNPRAWGLARPPERTPTLVAAAVAHPDDTTEFMTAERCAILESWNTGHDPGVSVVRARVQPGITTQLHALAVDERYLVTGGRGIVAIGDLPPEEISLGDVVAIPAGMRQKVTNNGDEDLVFYCICSPRFTPDAYTALEPTT